MDNYGKFQFEVIAGGNENILELEMWTVFHTSRGGWTEDEVTVKVDSDMDLIIRDGDNFIRLYPEQVVKMLEMIVPIYNKESLQNAKQEQ